MRIHAASYLFAFLASGQLIHANQAPAPDDFLDQPIGVTQYELKGYSEQLAQMEKIVSKPIIVPDGVVDFVTSINKGYFVTSTGIGAGPDASKDTKRGFLNMSCPRLGLAWNYDPSRDAIVLDFPWRRDDLRTKQQLIDCLTHSRIPQSLTKNLDPHIFYYLRYHKLAPDDTWRIAFDALLTKPDNFPNVWKLRLGEDMRSTNFALMPANNMLSSKMKDAAGAEHVLVVNSQPEFSNPGPVGSISYYVFDLQGKFEQGGLCSIGYRCMDASVWLDAAGKQLTLRVFNNGSYQIDEKFTLTKKGLIVGDVLDNGGTPMTGYRLMGTCYGLPLLHVPN
jgi:hypothetical protein